MRFFILDFLETVDGFFTAGGPILYLIAVTALLMWMLILERLWYYFARYQKDAALTIAHWESRQDYDSWSARAIRDKLISETRIRLRHNLNIIKTMIAICPLLGLLGTVTGMIDVFSGLASAGGGGVRVMAGGVSRATIPTMAGMVVALSGVFANIYVSRKATRECELIAENLTTIHRK